MTRRYPRPDPPLSIDFPVWLAVVAALLIVLALGGCVSSPSGFEPAPVDGVIDDLFTAGCDIASYETSVRYGSVKVTCK